MPARSTPQQSCDRASTHAAYLSSGRDAGGRCAPRWHELRDGVTWGRWTARVYPSEAICETRKSVPATDGTNGESHFCQSEDRRRGRVGKEIRSLRPFLWGLLGIARRYLPCLRHLFFWRAGAVLVSPHDGAVDHRVFVVGVCGQGLEHALPDAFWPSANRRWLFFPSPKRSGRDAMGRAVRAWHHRRCKQTTGVPHASGE